MRYILMFVLFVFFTLKVEGIEGFQYLFKALRYLHCNVKISHSLDSRETFDSLTFSSSTPNSINNANVKYVNYNVVGGNNDGSSWNNAFLNLQDALTVAQTGDTIWVAKGTYFTTSTTDRTKSFVLPKGVTVLGGFIGGESQASQRNFVVNETVLSGDIGNLGSFSDNSYHVVYCLGSDSTSVVDGFTITAGNASLSEFFGHYDRGGGVYIDTDSIHTTSTPVIKNCKFIKNRARYGGAICAESTTTEFANPSLLNCIFERNYATDQGGAVYVKGGSIDMPERYISGCDFIVNKSITGGGAVYIVDIDNKINFRNCSFERDSAQLSGGAILHESKEKFDKLSFDSCSFTQNLGQEGGAFCHYSTGVLFDSTQSNQFFFSNSLFQGNKSLNNRGGGIAVQNNNSSSTVEVNNSNFKANMCPNGGGGIYVGNYCTLPNLCNSEILVDGCKFQGNTSSLLGLAGAIYYQGFGGQGAKNNSKVTNSVFANNTGAITLISGYQGSANSAVVNCTFYKNGNWPISKNWDAGFGDDFFNNMEIANCIVWEYTPIYRMFYNNTANYTIEGYNIRHSIVNTPNCIVNGVDGCNEGMLYEDYPIFFDTLGGDLHVAACSPAINAGDNTAINELVINEDADGGTRILENIADIGAYERTSFDMNLSSVQNSDCVNTNSGSAEFEVTGNTPYILYWNNGTIAGNGSENLYSGNYLFKVVDTLGCSDSLTVIIGSNSNIELQSTITNLSEYNANDGTIIIDSVFGGFAPYEFLWDNGSVSSVINNLAAGDYFLTITDSINCSIIKQFHISSPDAVMENEFDLGEIFIAPNPASESIYCQLPIRIQKADLLLYTFTTQMVHKQIISPGANLISLVGICPGLYFYEVRDEGRVLKTGKLVKVE